RAEAGGETAAATHREQDGVPQGGRVARGDGDLEAVLARVTGPRHQHAYSRETAFERGERPQRREVERREPAQRALRLRSLHGDEGERGAAVGELGPASGVTLDPRAIRVGA